jgi:hypothetical protein
MAEEPYCAHVPPVFRRRANPPEVRRNG